jgi:plastocyanin
MRHLRVLAVGVGICIAIGVIACGNGVPSPSTSSGPPVGMAGAALGAATVTIQATDSNVFTPAKMTAHVGDIIEWSNTGSVLHTVTFTDHSELNDDTLAGGGVWQVKFTVAGTYPYICTIHQPDMKGTITVT